MNREQAEIIAIQVLEWVAADRDMMQSFLDAGGAGLEEVKDMAGEPAFLASVLDFLLGSDALVAGFCAAAGLGNDLPMRARRALPGGDVPNWT